MNWVFNSFYVFFCFNISKYVFVGWEQEVGIGGNNNNNITKKSELRERERESNT